MAYSNTRYGPEQIGPAKGHTPAAEGQPMILSNLSAARKWRLEWNFPDPTGLSCEEISAS